jgi:hypothetical protein
MKIFESRYEPIEFECIDQGAPFYYGNNKTLCMKVSTIIENNCYVNAVVLKDGGLVHLYNSEMVIPACVHIEND